MNETKTIPFETETVNLLHMMIHSVYVEKEVFLRELISNASDAIDKRYTAAIAKGDRNIGPLEREAYTIRISLNKKERLLRISDNGIGMDEEDLKNCLGKVAFSGTELMKKQQDTNLIGQFGIGFYSLFMVADKVWVLSRRANTHQAYVFESDGKEAYTITPAKRDNSGTDVILRIKQDDGKDTYNRYLREYPIYKLVRKHSDYIRWPILLYMPVPVPDKDGNPKEQWGWQLLNTMVPLWRRKQSDVSSTETDVFFNDQFQVAKPLSTLFIHTEGKTSFHALIAIPSQSWQTYDTKEDRKGLQLFVNGVKIQDFCTEVLPEEFSFVKGAVDCDHLDLNVSRESIQTKESLSSIRNILYKKILASLREAMDQRNSYEQFFAAFGKSIKLSAMEAENERRRELSELLLFHTSRNQSLTTLREYISRMKPEQNAIYYARGTNQPETERAEKLDIEYLIFANTEDILFAQVCEQFEGHRFISLSDDEPEPFMVKESPFGNEETEQLLKFFRSTLQDKVDAVKISQRLETLPSLLRSDNGISFVLQEQSEQDVRATRILELNVNHHAMATINKVMKTDPKRAETYVLILYNQAALAAHVFKEDMSAYTELLCSLFHE